MINKLKKAILAGAIGLAGLAGGMKPANAHDTIHTPNEYKIVIGPNMSTWKSIEYVLYGDNKGSSRPILEHRKVGKALVGAYETTLWDHELPEIDKHSYKSPEWKDHMERIVKIRSDYTGYGDIEYLQWVKRKQKMNKSDGLAMELAPGDHFYLPARAIENKELARALDRKDGSEDWTIRADGEPVKKQMQMPSDEDDKPDCIHPEEDAAEDGTTEEPELAKIPKAERKAGAIKLKAGYLSESLEGETFMDGPKFDIDFDYKLPIGQNWNLAIDNDNELMDMTFYNGLGKARMLKTELSGTFNRKVADSITVGAGPRLSMHNASVDYDGNKAELTDFALGAKTNAMLSTEHLDAKVAYSLSKGAGGDGEQGFNPITKRKVEVEAAAKLDPIIATITYEYERDNQEIRGVKRDNSDHKMEATLEYKITKDLAIGVGCEKNWHKGDANSTTATAYKGGLKLSW